MEVEFDDKDLERLLYDASYRSRLPAEVVKMFRKRLQFILSAPDERAFRTMASFHFEALQGDRQGQHSIRLNKQYRLVFRFEGLAPEKRLVVLAIEDYH